jgi:hypothetical protein
MPRSEKRSWVKAALLGLGMTGLGLWRLIIRRPVHANVRKELVNHDVMYEARDVDASIFAWVLVGVIVAAFVIHGIVKLSYGYFSRTEFRAAQPVTLINEVPKPPPMPQLQVSPARDLEQLRRSEEQVLSSYGWVDRKNGVVRIPIEEAMKHVLEKGLPPAEKTSSTVTKQAVQK